MMTEQFNPFDEVGSLSVPINIHGYEGKIIWKYNSCSWKVAIKDNTYGSWIKVVTSDLLSAKQREDAETLLIEHANESIALVLDK